MAAIKKIIFDNDGVNIDSEHIAMGDMAEFGYTMAAKYVDVELVGLKENDIYVEYKGQSSNDIIKHLIEKLSLPEDAIREDYDIPDDADLYEFLSDLHTKSVINKFESGKLETLPGFKKTMETIRGQFGGDNIALCTTSRADRMHATQHAKDPENGTNAGWADFFPDRDNLRLSGYGHANKYIHFTEMHPDWDPEETVIIEDTAGSTKKALEAGFENVIGVVVSKFQCFDDNGHFNQQKQYEEIRRLLEVGACIVVTDYTDISLAIDWMNDGMDINNVPAFKGQVFENKSGIHASAPELDL